MVNWTITSEPFSWIDISNPDVAELQTISETYNLHNFVLKDCLEPDHLPKHEDLTDFQFIITRILNHETGLAENTIQGMSNKIAIFYNDSTIITIHRKPFPFLEELKTKFYDNQKLKFSQELVIKIIWQVLHSYDQPAIQLVKEFDDFETHVFKKTGNSDLLEGLYLIKRKASVRSTLLTLTGEVIQSIKATKNASVALQDIKELRIKLLTIYDQIHQDSNNLLNIYLSLSAQKTNEVMKVLTIFSVFFMPLTFLVGVYGMNFEFMPELSQKWGYPILLIIMLLISVVIYFVFRKRKWL